MDKRLEFIITTKEQPAPVPIQFEQISEIKDNITSMVLLWDANSYYVNVARRYFIINGGRRISVVEHFKGITDLQILYYKRHTETLSFGSNGDTEKKGRHQVSYLLGLYGTRDGEQIELMLHISPDGKEWYWRDKR